MQTKLTLRVDDQLIRDAKRFAQESEKSVSRIVADYLALVVSPTQRDPEDLPPAVRRLRGALQGAPIEESDYRAFLEAKHR